MQIKLKTQYAGPSGCHAAGSTVDFEKAEAYRLIEGGYAEQVEDAAAAVPAAVVVQEVGDEKPVVETTDLLPPETTEAPANRRHKRRS